MMLGKITTEVTIEPTPQQLAEAFCSMDCDEMAQFFNSIYNRTQEWDSPATGFEYQVAGIVMDKWLTDGGKYIMETLGEVVKDV